MNPDFNHFSSIFRSMKTFRRRQSWSMLSKQPTISPSRIHSGDDDRDSTLKHRSIASATERYGRNP